MPQADLPLPVLWIAGVLLLLAGRRLYWLFIGLAGFVVGFAVAERLLDLESAALELVLALLAGVAAALVTVLVKRLAVAAIGFLGGAALLVLVADALAWELGAWIWLAALAAGVAGAVLVRGLFEIGLIVLSALSGASLIVQATGWGDPDATILFVALAAAGVLVQLAVSRPRRRR